MSDKISERKPDGGLQEWIDFYEMVTDGDTDATELLVLLIELRAHRSRAADVQAVKPVKLPEHDEPLPWNELYPRGPKLKFYDASGLFNYRKYQRALIAAIKAAGGTVEGE